jgi:hypothetical protein
LARHNALPKKANLNDDDRPKKTFMARPGYDLVRRTVPHPKPKKLNPERLIED